MAGVHCTVYITYVLCDLNHLRCTVHVCSTCVLCDLNHGRCTVPLCSVTSIMAGGHCTLYSTCVLCDLYHGALLVAEAGADTTPGQDDT